MGMEKLDPPLFKLSGEIPEAWQPDSKSRGHTWEQYKHVANAQVQALIEKCAAAGLLYLDTNEDNIMRKGAELRFIDWESGITETTNVWVRHAGACMSNYSDDEMEAELEEDDDDDDDSENTPAIATGQAYVFPHPEPTLVDMLRDLMTLQWMQGRLGGARDDMGEVQGRIQARLSQGAPMKQFTKVAATLGVGRRQAHAPLMELKS